MTMLVAAKFTFEDAPAVLVATDSMLSCGYRWPRGPKLATLGATAVMAFEGATELAYPLMLNARNFVDHSDNLGGPEADPVSLFHRVRADVSNAYDELVASDFFDPSETRCSFLLGGWSTRRRSHVVWSLRQPPADAPPRTQWDMLDVQTSAEWRAHHCFFAGNGDRDPVGAAWAFVDAGVHNQGPILAYEAFMAQLDDPGETGVGGHPQVALLRPGTREIVGIEDTEGRRHLLGHLVLSGAQRNVRYADRHLTTLA